MVITTLVLSFLLSFLPLVIGTLSFRYAKNPFSRGILGLSATSFLLGLAQFGLILGLSYRLFPADLANRASVWLQYVSIAGGVVMIFAGMLWVGYFRTLMKARAAVRKPLISPALASVRTPVTAAPAPAVKPPPKKRRESPQPVPASDWFSEELGGGAQTFKLAAVVEPKKRVRKAPKKKA